MGCVACGSAAATERPERTARGDRRFRCRDCGRPCDERSASLLNHAQYPSDVIALAVLWRLHGCVAKFGTSRKWPRQAPTFAPQRCHLHPI
jgi:transposase-like protein